MQVVPTKLQRSKEEIEMEKIAIQKERLRIQKKEQTAKNIKTALGIAGAIGTAALGLYMAKEKIRAQDAITLANIKKIDAGEARAQKKNEFDDKRLALEEQLLAIKMKRSEAQLPPTAIVRDVARATVDASRAAQNIGTMVPKTGLGKAAAVGTLLVAGSTIAPDVVSTGVNYATRNMAESFGKTVTRLPVTVAEGIFSGAKEGLQGVYKSYHPDQAVPHAALRGGKDPEWVVTGGVRGIGHYQKPPSVFNVLMNDKLPGTNTTMRDVLQGYTQAVQYDIRRGAVGDFVPAPTVSEVNTQKLKLKPNWTRSDHETFGQLSRAQRREIRAFKSAEFAKRKRGYGKTRK